MRKRQNSSFGDILGAIADGFWNIIKGLIRLTVKVFVTFGLWLPAFYALLGVILFYACDFNPFDFTVYSVIYLSGGVACVVCCVIISVRNVIVVPVKRVFDKKNDKTESEWLTADAEDEERAKTVKQAEEDALLAPPNIVEDKKGIFVGEDEYRYADDEDEEVLPPYLTDGEDFKPKDEEERAAAKAELFDILPKKTKPTAESTVAREPKKEIPDIYFSKLQKNLLIYEYSDRFETYKLEGGKTVPVGVEYK